jgi:hypothetical protein
MTLAPILCIERVMTAKPKPDDPEQYKRFLEAAEKAEASESEKEANRAFKKVASPKKRKVISNGDSL